MISYSSLLLFVTGAAILLVIPGPAVFYIVSRSVGHGRAAGLVSAMGIAAGTLFHLAAATLGLSALLASSALVFQFVKYLGAACLVYLGIRVLQLGVLFALMGWCSDSMWALLAGTVAERIRGSVRLRRTQRNLSGGALIALGLATAFSGVRSK
ncbi:MAG: hypothetical protein DMG53_01755 [Acidobacteria bacterium]|nr:MAG: hypothetical protein DMG53_01755 [Acidobacteriota bacterium]